jgi:hypothetical protein
MATNDLAAVRNICLAIQRTPVFVLNEATSSDSRDAIENQIKLTIETPRNRNLIALGSPERSNTVSRTFRLV